MPTTPKFDPAALGLTVETAGYRPASLETGEADTTRQIGYSKALPDGFTQHYGMNGENLGISKDKSTWDSIKPLVGMAAGAVLPGVFSPWLQGAGLTGMGLSAATGALTGAGSAALTGGNIGQGMLLGGAGGALTNYLAPANLGPMENMLDNYDVSSMGDPGLTGDPYSYIPSGNQITANPGQYYDHLTPGGLTSSDPGMNTGSTATLTPVGITAPRLDGPLTVSAPNLPTGINLPTVNVSGTKNSGAAKTDETGNQVLNPVVVTGTKSGTIDTKPDDLPVTIPPVIDPKIAGNKTLVDSIIEKYKDPKTGEINWPLVIATLGLITSTIGKLTASDPPKVKTIDELMTQVKPAGFDTPLPTGGAPASWGARQRIYSADMKTPIVAGRRFAEGGEVEGALTMAAPFSGFVEGEGGGQDDLIDASLSAGEYVFDAESVSMLGDGNNSEGARKLDELRASLRAHKRSAPDDQIAPPAQGALSYMNGGQ